MTRAGAAAAAARRMKKLETIVAVEVVGLPGNNREREKSKMNNEVRCKRMLLKGLMRYGKFRLGGRAAVVDFIDCLSTPLDRGWLLVVGSVPDQRNVSMSRAAEGHHLASSRAPVS